MGTVRASLAESHGTRDWALCSPVGAVVVLSRFWRIPHQLTQQPTALDPLASRSRGSAMICDPSPDGHHCHSQCPQVTNWSWTAPITDKRFFFCHQYGYEIAPTNSAGKLQLAASATSSACASGGNGATAKTARHEPENSW